MEQTNGTDLPLVVWLKGDEDYFTDFCLDADEVMKRLGIKRTRLTQISGKEIRVGRTKEDRYIKPRYRPADVDAYLNWRRSSMSGVRSSQTIQEAAELLKETGAVLAQTVRDEMGRYLRPTVRLFSARREPEPDADREILAFAGKQFSKHTGFLSEIRSTITTLGHGIDMLKTGAAETLSLAQGHRLDLKTGLAHIESVISAAWHNWLAAQPKPKVPRRYGQQVPRYKRYKHKHKQRRPDPTHTKPTSPFSLRRRPPVI